MVSAPVATTRHFAFRGTNFCHSNTLCILWCELPYQPRDISPSASPLSQGPTSVTTTRRLTRYGTNYIWYQRLSQHAISPSCLAIRLAFPLCVQAFRMFRLVSRASNSCFERCRILGLRPLTRGGSRSP